MISIRKGGTPKRTMLAGFRNNCGSSVGRSKRVAVQADRVAAHEEIVNAVGVE